MKFINILIISCLSLLISAAHHKDHEKDPKSLAFKAYETFAAGDSKAWAKIHTEDFRFTIFGDLPQSGVKVGTDKVIKEVFEVIPVYWPTFKLTPISTEVIGNKVYVHNKMTADNLDTETMHVFTIRDGKIASFTAFEDTDSMRKAMVK
tara:strand:+ start:190 stop:636 length:447 start_codon:yes stop_codon:yes gene_type:complete